MIIIEDIVDMPDMFHSLPCDLSRYIYQLYFQYVIQELDVLGQLKNKRNYLKKQNSTLHTNESVVIYWLNGISHNSQKRDHKRDQFMFHTDGHYLYSIDKVIGYTKKNRKYIYNYTASNNKFISYTCSRHINLAKKYCDFVID